MNKKVISKIFISIIFFTSPLISDEIDIEAKKEKEFIRDTIIEIPYLENQKSISDPYHEHLEADEEKELDLKNK